MGAGEDDGGAESVLVVVRLVVEEGGDEIGVEADDENDVENDDNVE